MTDEDLIHHLRHSKGWPTLGNAAADRIEALIRERDALTDALVEAEAERHRWRKAAAMGSIHTQADLDRAAQEARALALEEAREALRDDFGSVLYDCAEIDKVILALIGPPAAEALAERDAQIMQIILDDVGYTYEQLGEEAREKLPTPAGTLERVRAESYLSGWVNGSNGIEPPDFGNPVFDDDAIRARGKT